MSDTKEIKKEKHIIVKDINDQQIFIVVKYNTTEVWLNKMIEKHNLQFVRNPNRDWPFILMHKDSKYIPVNNIMIASVYADIDSGAVMLDEALKEIDSGKIETIRIRRDE